MRHDDGGRRSGKTRKRTGGRKGRAGADAVGKGSGNGGERIGRSGAGKPIGRLCPHPGANTTPLVTGRSSGSPSSSSANLPGCGHPVAWSRFVRLTAAGAAPECLGRACSPRSPDFPFHLARESGLGTFDGAESNRLHRAGASILHGAGVRGSGAGRCRARLDEDQLAGLRVAENLADPVHAGTGLALAVGGALDGAALVHGPGCG